MAFGIAASSAPWPAFLPVATQSCLAWLCAPPYNFSPSLLGIFVQKKGHLKGTHPRSQIKISSKSSFHLAWDVDPVWHGTHLWGPSGTPILWHTIQLQCSLEDTGVALGEHLLPPAPTAELPRALQGSGLQACWVFGWRWPWFCYIINRFVLHGVWGFDGLKIRGLSHDIQTVKRLKKKNQTCLLFPLESCIRRDTFHPLIQLSVIPWTQRL